MDRGPLKPRTGIKTDDGRRTSSPHRISTPIVLPLREHDAICTHPCVRGFKLVESTCFFCTTPPTGRRGRFHGALVSRPDQREKNLMFCEKKKEPKVTRLCSRLDETNKLFAAVSRVLVLVGRRKRCMSFFEKACKKWRGRYEPCINHVAIALRTIKVCQHGDQRVKTTFRLWLRKKIAIWAFCILSSEREKL